MPCYLPLWAGSTRSFRGKGVYFLLVPKYDKFAILRPGRIFVALALGVVLTLAGVAALSVWGRGTVRLIDMAERSPTAFELGRWKDHAPPEWRSEMPQVRHQGTFGWRLVVINAHRESTTAELADVLFPGLPNVGPISESFLVDVELIGWPIPCAYLMDWNGTTKGALNKLGESAIRIGDHRFPARLKPLAVAGNLLLYALATWLVLTGLAVMTSSRRLRANRCPKCAYQLGDHAADGCPECGWGRAS